MVSLGHRLKSERERRSFSLEEIALATNIKIAYLEAIEQDDFDSLPHDTFVKGYLRAYSFHVGLNQEEVIKAYDYVSSFNRPDRDLVKDLLETLSDSAPQKKTKLSPLLIAGSAAVLLAAAFMIYFFKGKFTETAGYRESLAGSIVPVKKVRPVFKVKGQAEEKEPVQAPVVVLPPKQVPLEAPVKKLLPSKKEVVQKIAYSTADRMVNKIPIKKAAPKTNSTIKPLEIAGRGISLSKAPTSRKRSTSSTKTILAASKVRPALRPVTLKKKMLKKNRALSLSTGKFPGSGLSTAKFSRPKLTVYAQKKIWLLIRVDRKGLEHVILNKGETKSWQGKKGIVFSLGDPGAVEVAINGQKLADFKNKARKRRNYRISAQTSRQDFFE